MIENGEILPELVGKNAAGEDVRLDQYGAGSWTVVLFYRGHW